MVSGIFSVFLECKKCGARYLFNPCGLVLEPLSIKAMIGCLKSTFDVIFRGKYHNFLSGECPYCGGKLERVGYC